MAKEILRLLLVGTLSMGVGYFSSSKITANSVYIYSKFEIDEVETWSIEAFNSNGAEASLLAQQFLINLIQLRQKVEWIDDKTIHAKRGMANIRMAATLLLDGDDRSAKQYLKQAYSDLSMSDLQVKDESEIEKLAQLLVEDRSKHIKAKN